jgi:hypothetical protein
MGELVLLGIEWARQKGYLFFESSPLGQDTEIQSPIQVDEQIAGWASGYFAVGGKRRYLVNETAGFSYVRSREHVVMAYVRQTRFLLLAKSAQGDVGMWYVFFAPSRVRRIERGYIQCGIRTRPGLALTYQPEEQPDQEATIYLTFADVDTVQRVIADLCIDIAPQVTII